MKKLTIDFRSKNLVQAFFVFTLGFFTHGSIAAEVGDPAPNIELTAIAPNGMDVQIHLLDVAKNQKFVLLDFSQTTCPACHENQPIFSKLAAELVDSVSAVTVMIDRNPANSRAYVAKNKSDFHYNVALDNDRKALTAYATKYTPTMVLVDAKQNIVWTKIGVLSTGDLKKIKNLVAQGLNE